MKAKNGNNIFFRKLSIAMAAIVLPVFLLAGCGSSKPLVQDRADYPDPPEDEWIEVLPIYNAFDGGSGENVSYKLSADNIVGEGAPPKAPEAVEDDGMEVIEADWELPGGRTEWFKGISPGDVVITFTTENDGGKAIYIQEYHVRVFDDLRLALLHVETTDLRG